MTLKLALPVRALLMALLPFAVSAAAQVKNQPPIKEEKTVAETKVSTQLLDENAYYRVSRLQLAPGSGAQVRQHGRDAVIVVFGEDGLTMTTPKVPKPERLTDNEVRFLARGVDRSIANSSGKASQALLVELKRHWNLEIQPCVEPMKCTRPIQMGESEIGETTSLFTNGFITAYRHHLITGGTLTSSYFSTTGKDHLLLVALTDLRASFDNTEESLKRGEAYTSDATAVEVNAKTDEARWVVIRVLVPKP
jgi:hypothetical protein